jgi:hypothetical protein
VVAQAFGDIGRKLSAWLDGGSGQKG